MNFVKNITNTPQSGYTQMMYGDGTRFTAYSAAGVGHTVPVHENVDLAWFGIRDCMLAQPLFEQHCREGSNLKYA